MHVSRFTARALSPCVTASNYADSLLLGHLLLMQCYVMCSGQALGGVAPVLAGPGYLMPELIRDQLYDLVANNRYSLMGKRDTCRCSDPKFADRFI
jgi:hypothetical protein